LILIDTPGHSPAEGDLVLDLAHYLSAHEEIESHLVLNATAKSADLRSAVARFGAFRPRKLIFTRVDETVSLGAVAGEAARSGLPVAFLGTGQQIPEDLEEATVERLISGMQIRGGMEASKAA
jgi:flagellar biosynthesis protein FlhF